jgi:FkbH-like protein
MQEMSHSARPSQSHVASQQIKCVVWDLDNTLWQGVLLEDEQTFLRARVLEILTTLDERGILQSIASKNDYTKAMDRLRELGLDEYFLYPQINWNSKAHSLKIIAQALNIGVDTLAFVDDQASEREEVRFSLSEVLCIDAAELDRVLEMPEMIPRFLTEDARMRRHLYVSEIERSKKEEEFVGPAEEFLASLQMKLTISSALEEDLQRAEELTLRTHQLNTTGYTYSYDELNNYRESEQHKLLISDLRDIYGDYGKIGVALIECLPNIWTIKLLLMSCRVMSKGIGTVMLQHIMCLAKAEHVRLQAEFISNKRNRMMYVAYTFAGFKETSKHGAVTILENALTHIQPFPDYMQVQILDKATGL